jgi:hypothetical protein
MYKKYFISIGCKDGVSSNHNKVAIICEETKIVQTVKLMRKNFYEMNVINKKSGDKNFSMLSWAIYDNVESNIPIKHSENWIQ